MDFKDFINQIKELADPAVFAIIAKFAILFYVLKIFLNHVFLKYQQFQNQNLPLRYFSIHL